MIADRGDRPEGDASPESEVTSLREQVTRLKEAVEARDTFIAVAAHELRNPMTPMIGQLDLLLAGMRSGRFPAEQIEQRVERIQSLMTHYIKRSSALLDVSRITSGNLRLVPTSCDLAIVLNGVVESFEDAARHAGASIEVRAPPSVAGTWDQLAVEQIIDNLVSNAIKYAAPGRIEAWLIDLDDRIQICIRDHGRGISPEDRARIFERFEQATIGRRSHGFGVGLWVVGQLVGAMRGTIEVKDAPGGGASFSVCLPRHVVAGEAA